MDNTKNTTDHNKRVEGLPFVVFINEQSRLLVLEDGTRFYYDPNSMRLKKIFNLEPSKSDDLYLSGPKLSDLILVP